jgi:hypothetical protein
MTALVERNFTAAAPNELWLTANQPPRGPDASQVGV